MKLKQKRRKRGGAIVDLGNVIIHHWMSGITSENFDTFDYDSIPEVPRSFAALKALNDKFGGNITVVYKATDIATEKIMSWLSSHQFTERTGIPPTRVCRTMKGRDKTSYLKQSSATHCGTTMVVDDRLEVLSYFVTEAPDVDLFLFIPQPQEVEMFRHTGALSRVHLVQGWQDIEEFYET